MVSYLERLPGQVTIHENTRSWTGCAFGRFPVISWIVLNPTRMCRQKKSRPRLFAGGLPVKLLGLTCGCDCLGKKVSQ